MFYMYTILLLHIPRIIGRELGWLYHCSFQQHTVETLCNTIQYNQISVITLIRLCIQNSFFSIYYKLFSYNTIHCEGINLQLHMLNNIKQESWVPMYQRNNTTRVHYSGSELKYPNPRQHHHTGTGSNIHPNDYSSHFKVISPTPVYNTKTISMKMLTTINYLVEAANKRHL